MARSDGGRSKTNHLEFELHVDRGCVLLGRAVGQREDHDQVESETAR